MDQGHGGILHLREAGVSVLVDCTGDRLPRVAHWGADLGDVPMREVAEIVRTGVPPVAPGSTDHPVPVSVLPEQSVGWTGTPGITGHREGTAFSVAFTVRAVDHVTDPGPGVAHRVGVTATDDAAGLELDVELELLVGGLLRTRATLTSTGHGTFDLGTLDLLLPVPSHAVEILDFTGRHLRERSPQRAPFDVGTRLRESRRGRAHDATVLMAAGERGFGYRSGQVWGVHVAWSGNTRVLAERDSTGARLLGGGELLLAGEVRLARGARYRTPWLYASFGRGLDELSARFHKYLRGRPHHPRSPRPVLLNVWEAVYFDHDLARLTRLADVAAAVGVERFVLDDGWFRNRRDDTAGLGDWYVDESVWPDGLGPLVAHVRGLGMQFGLWFEPEMVSPDSDLGRAHPEWMLQTGGRIPPTARHQQVLDLTHPGAYAHVLDRMAAIVGEHAVDYVKWDHNRDLIDAGHWPDGGARVHEQTLAAYRLMDELRERHPGLEIESCAGGGGRTDLEIMERAERVWVSDCIDALERQHIEAGIGLLLPPELMGSHIGAPAAHTTGRTHALSFRAGTAFFSHLGIEWDLTRADEGDLAELTRWIAAHRRHRDLLHHGSVVHADHPDPALWVHGVVADDAAEALYAVVALRTSETAPPGRVRLPGLDPHGTYEVLPLDPADTADAVAQPVGWWRTGAHLAGRTLTTVGIQLPTLLPERLVLLHAARASAGPPTG